MKDQLCLSKDDLQVDAAPLEADGVLLLPDLELARGVGDLA